VAALYVINGNYFSNVIIQQFRMATPPVDDRLMEETCWNMKDFFH
jgi:hypothetical protein